MDDFLKWSARSALFPLTKPAIPNLLKVAVENPESVAHLDRSHLLSHRAIEIRDFIEGLTKHQCEVDECLVRLRAQMKLIEHWVWLIKTSGASC